MCRDPVTLEYYASIQQMSGEDRGNVTMTLSTATPSLVAKAPSLAAMTIALTSPTPAQVQLAYADARRELSKKQKDVECERAQNRQAGKNSPSGGMDDREGTWRDDAVFDKSLNEFANSIQVLDLVAGNKVSREEGTSGPRRASEEGISVTYTIATKTTMPSRNDRQMIQIAAIPLKADFAKLATPVLTDYVYDEARAINSSNMVLLAGPVTA